jgi:hypothetical protein
MLFQTEKNMLSEKLMNLIYLFQIRWPPTRHVLLVLTYLFAVNSFVICLVRDQNNKYSFQICFSIMVTIIQPLKKIFLIADKKND